MPAFNKMLKLDRIDKHILALLQRDTNVSNQQIADAVGLSATPCLRRIKRLEEQGVIASQVTLLNQNTLGLSLTAIIGISMDRHTPDRFENFESAIAELPEIIECSVVTGQQADYLIKAVLPDMAHYEAFLLGKLTKIKGVTGVHSSFVLRKVINRTALPLDHL